MGRRPPMSSNGRGAVCFYCERVLEATASRSRVAATRDHIHPKSKGGERKVWACRQCNLLKGDMTYEEWLAFMAAHPEWWKRPEFHRGTYGGCEPGAVEAKRSEWWRKLGESGSGE